MWRLTQSEGAKGRFAAERLPASRGSRRGRNISDNDLLEGVRVPLPLSWQEGGGRDAGRLTMEAQTARQRRRRGETKGWYRQGGQALHAYVL
jgi:hypothetical protein